MAKCIVCGRELTGRHIKFCSRECYLVFKKMKILEKNNKRNKQFKDLPQKEQEKIILEFSKAYMEIVEEELKQHPELIKPKIQNDEEEEKRFKKEHEIKTPTRCRAITKDGKRCSRKSVLQGYCLTHWFMRRGMLRRKKR